MPISNRIRSGCKDVWNAFMCEGASFSTNDIPFCPTTAAEIPAAIITWDEAKRLYKNALARKDYSFFCNAFVCWYIDDYKFDGPRGIWHDCKFVLRVLRHFAGAITPDFSTYQDFPEPLKKYNVYRMRVFGYWLGKNGIAVINNCRWGTRETWQYCWDGIPKNSVICIGTVGGSPRRLVDRRRFEEGMEELVRVLQPQTILVFGSAKYTCFDRLGSMSSLTPATQRQPSIKGGGQDEQAIKLQVHRNKGPYCFGCRKPATNGTRAQE